ncbi:MAG: DUF4144 domain-containing protein [Candidatus Oceanisphaera merdipullorum]|nr:DUF4144 domain-containing protein [Candidatus Oceanisphaera merdipullorum]
MIHWPVIIICEQGANYAWADGPEQLAEQGLWRGDRLIDSQGGTHILSQQNDDTLYWHRQPELVSLAELNIELKLYAASLGVCCTAKLVTRTLADAMALVAWLELQ